MVRCLVALALLTSCGKRDAAPAPQATEVPAVMTPPPAPPPPPPPTTPVKSDEDPRAVYIRSNYAKFEYRVPMRDGVRLFTAVYVPNDASPAKKYPMMLFRTPYSVAPYGLDRYRASLGPTPAFEQDGFIFVAQDVRGRHMSEGTFADVRPIGTPPDEATDTYDTIDWLLKNVPHNTGKVGQWGVSYPGFYTSTGAISAHPALVASSPQAPIADWWVGDDMHRNGALTLQMVFGFFTGFGVPRPHPTDNEDSWRPFPYGTPDAYQFFLDAGPVAKLDFKNDIGFWKDAVAHPDYDEFWKARNILPRLKGIKAATLVVGGWYDVEDLYGAVETYRAIEAQNPGARNTLVIGPWTHGEWIRGAGEKVGDAQFGFKTAEGFRLLLFAFFKQHLKGGPDAKLPEALVFETGANRWRNFTAWPPREASETKFFLGANGALTKTAPTETGVDDYVSDPARPVPHTLDPQTSKWNGEFYGEDQRFAARRPDVLVYESQPLERDTTIAGPIDVELYVSTTGTDADWVVKVIDASPGRMPGYKERDYMDHKPDLGSKQILVRGEPFRGRYRNDPSKPEPFVPGEVAKVAFRLDDVFHTFKRNHRIIVQVQSSWFPFIDRNPQTFVNIYTAKASDFVKQTHRVHRAAATPSAIKVRLLPPPDAP